ncbi:hypothetical protein GCM10009717_14090 [Agromyces allii]|uniref:Uncharacterized protein n=1 Tax=Agromyces allii TaxID=393607 RepID=A0ABN2QBE5_9MICO
MRRMPESIARAAEVTPRVVMTQPPASEVQVSAIRQMSMPTATETIPRQSHPFDVGDATMVREMLTDRLPAPVVLGT